MRWARLVVFILIATVLQADLVNVVAVSPANIKPDLLLILLVFFAVFGGPKGAGGEYTSEKVGQLGSIKVVGKLLFTDYLLPFEIVSILLLAAIVGAIVLATQRPFERE